MFEKNFLISAATTPKEITNIIENKDVTEVLV